MRDKKLADDLQRIPDFICMEEACMKKDAVEAVKNTGYTLCYDFHWWQHHFFFTQNIKAFPAIQKTCE